MKLFRILVNEKLKKTQCLKIVAAQEVSLNMVSEFVVFPCCFPSRFGTYLTEIQFGIVYCMWDCRRLSKAFQNRNVPFVTWM